MFDCNSTALRPFDDLYVMTVWRYRNSLIIIIIIMIIILPSVSIPEGGLKIDKNKLKGYDTQSVQSVTGRLSCSRTAFETLYQHRNSLIQMTSLSGVTRN